MKYISLLRGINVSGKNPIKMDDLRDLYVSLGFDGVETYIQSGNVVFDHDTFGTAELQKRIETAISKRFGFDVTVMVRTHPELAALIDKSPFENGQAIENSKLYHITFLEGQPVQADIDALLQYAVMDEELYLGERAVYLFCPQSYGRTKLSNSFLESKLKMRATTRNWKTLLTLLEMSRNEHK